MTTLAGRLEAGLSNILVLMNQLLDASTIDYQPHRARYFAAQHGIAAVIPDGLWGPSNDTQQQIQRRLLEIWRPWLEQMTLLFSEDTSSRKNEVSRAAQAVQRWIERQGDPWGLPATISEAKVVFVQKCEPLFAALRSLGAATGRVLAVPDTNVLLRTPDIATYGTVLGTKSYTVVLVAGVLGELDSHKVNHRNPDVRDKARAMSNRIKGWRNQGDLAKGVRVQGDVWVQVHGREPDFTKTLAGLDPAIVDDRIIATVLELQRGRPTDRLVILSGDTLMLTKADGANVPSVDPPDADP